MSKRAEQWLDIGMDVYRKFQPSGLEVAMLAAFAAMLDHALPAKTTRKAKSPDAPRLPFTPREFYEELRARTKVQCVPVKGSLFGRLGKTLQDIQGLEHEDMDRLVGWIEAGGLSFWKGVPSFEHVVANLSKWIPIAREWEKRGRQSLHTGKSNVGSESWSSGPDLGSAFK